MSKNRSYRRTRVSSTNVRPLGYWTKRAMRKRVESERMREAERRARMAKVKGEKE